MNLDCANTAIMKKLLFFPLLLLLISSGFGQNFEPAPVDRAVVYFSSPYISTVGLLGFAFNIPIYKEDGEGIGILTYRNFFRYECEPGLHYFWTTKSTYATKISAIEANLDPGKIYLVLAQEVHLGPGGNITGIVPVDTTTDNEQLEDILKVLNNKNSIKANQIYMKRQDKYYKLLNKNKRLMRNHEIFTKKIDKVLEKEKIKILPKHWFIEPEDMYRDSKKMRNKEIDTKSVS